MAVNFPDNPSNGQTVTFGSTTYTYNSTKGIWSSSGTSSSVDNYLEVANSTVFVTKADAVASNNAIKVLIDDRLQVANLQPQLDAYLQVANVESYAFASEKVFTVTNSGSGAYLFYGVGTGADASQANSNPTLYLSRGEKYTFNVNASGHPFYINTTNATGTGNAFANGVINNGAAVGNVVFTVPMNAPDTLHYNCQYHSSMNGTIYVLSQTSTDTSSFQTKADATAANNALLSLIQDRLQVANLQPQLDKYLQVGNAVSLTAFDVITTTPSGNGSLSYSSSNGSFTFTPANATQGGVGGGGSGNTNLTVSDSAPGSPSDGDLWFDSEDLIMYVYYDDGSSSQWVKTSPSSSTDVSGYLQVANLQPQLDKYLQVANSTSFTTTSSFDVLTSTPSGNGSLVYNSSNGSFTFTPADATQGGGGGGGGASVTASDTAPSSPSAGDLWFHTTQLKLYVYYSDGSSNQWVQTNSGVGNRVDEFIKAYRYQGTLAINTGDTRLYLQDSYILKGIHAYVDTAPVGSSVITDVKKNGSSLQTITVAAGATSASNTSLSHTFVSGDYLTVDITQVGSSTAGTNLYMVFTFN